MFYIIKINKKVNSKRIHLFTFLGPSLPIKGTLKTSRIIKYEYFRHYIDCRNYVVMHFDHSKKIYMFLLDK